MRRSPAATGSSTSRTPAETASASTHRQTGLARGQPSPVKSGDRILIGPYDIRVSIARDQPTRRGSTRVSCRTGAHPNAPFGASHAFDLEDPFAPQPVPASSGWTPPKSRSLVRNWTRSSCWTWCPSRLPARKAKHLSAKDLEPGSPLDNHFQPPEPSLPAPAPSPASAPRADAISIPHDYNPLCSG